jgi:flagellar biogenesis protein FliO
MLHGINFTFFLSALIAVIALILAFFIKRVKPHHENQTGEEAAVKD